MCNCAFLIVHCNVLSCNAISCKSIHCNATGNALSPVQYLQRIHISTRHAKPPLNCFSNVQCPPSTIFHTTIYSTLWALQLSRFPRSAFPVPEFPHSGPTTECAWILSFWFISQDLRQNSTPTIVKTQVFKQNLPKMLLETKRLWNKKSSHSWEKFENCQNRQTESWFCIIKCFLSKK